MEIIFIPCGECGEVYGTEAKEGQSVCPSCGGITQLLEIPGREAPDGEAVAEEYRQSAERYPGPWSG